MSPYFEHIDEADRAQETLESLRAGRVPIRGTFTCFGIHKKSAELAPIVWVDTSKHPNVARLTNISADDPIADVTTWWRFAFVPRKVYVVLEVTTLLPIATTFKLCFRLPKHENFLTQVVHYGKLGITAKASAPSGRAFFFEADDETLTLVMAMYQQQRALLARGGVG